jgi:undecaprenyl-diphosphatase
MPEWIAVVLLGFIEGVTEFIPVSSTGHLLLAEHLQWLPRRSDLFNIVIQCGAVLAVLPLFPQRLNQIRFRWREKTTQDYLLKLFAAFVITGIGGVAWKILGHELPKELTPVAWALLIGGIAFLAVEWLLRGRKLTNDVTWLVVFAVGLAQLVAAIFPGISRSGSTILVCLLLGLARPAATEFSFLVGIPTMLAAGGLEIFKRLYHHSAHPVAENWSMVWLGTIVAAAVSFVAVKWLLRYVQTHTFTAFGWYRIALALIVFAAGHL